MGKARTIARRTFLIGSTAIAGGVVFGTFLYRKSIPNPLLDNLADGEAAITPYVKIDSQGVTLITPRCDVGQGAYSIQASLIAEELDVDPFKVTVSPGLPDAAYYNSIVLSEGLPFAAYDESWLAGKARDFAAVPAKILGVQLTGGSTTVPDAFAKLRMAGAVARETLKEAAAQKRGVPRASLTTKDGHVVFADGSQLAYTDLALEAARLAPIENLSLRPTSEWKLLGKRRQRVDIVAKSTGTLEYGIDLALPGMVYASVRTNPGIGGKITDYDASAAKAMRGVIRIVPIRHGIGVVADNTWRAMRAVNAIDIDWGPGSYPSSQEELWQTLVDTFEDRYDSRNKDEGDVEEIFSNDGANIIEAEYRVPYLAHAPLEPMNAIVKVGADSVEIWTGTQIPRFVQQHVADLVEMDVDAVKLYVQPMGGSFGRRLDDNYILQAVEIAQAMQGTPVKMTWTREEDMTHDYPRPAAIARVKGAVAQGQVVAYDFHVASQSVTESWSGRLLGTVPGPDPSIVSGAWDQPLAIPNYRVTGYRAPEMVPISPWRSVGYSGVGFLHGGFLDELFEAADVDPLDELIRLCNYDLARNVLQKVKEISGWSGRQIGEGRARGVAFTMSFGVPTAEVVEVSQSDRGIVVDRVFVAAEVGTVLDPVNLEAQVEGGVIWGLGHAMNCELTYRDHAPVQTNFHTYQGMRLYQAPEIVVVALQHGDKIRGIGEPPVPPAAAALANAVYALTGKRIRELPLNKHIDFA
tara:strand:- start:7055 stop:9301 length:2247 start_codon:yes stop_codon:yes gene_type:complete